MLNWKYYKTKNMKKIYLSIIGITAFAVLSSGQTKLCSTDNAFKEGDSHEFILTTVAEEGQSGEKVIWDFSNLKSTNQTLTSHMLNVSSSEKSALIPEANLILEEFGNLFFFKVTSNGMEQYGVSSCNSVTKFNKPFVKLKFNSNMAIRLQVITQEFKPFKIRTQQFQELMRL